MLVLGLTCQDPDEQASTAPKCSTELGVGLCSSEPRPQIVHLTGCRDDDDCPIGSICSPCQFQATGQPIAAECVVPEVFPNHAGDLQSGFEVPTFVKQRLVDTESGTQVLEWTAPAGTRVVVCALFNCPPIFEDGAIRNHERCVASRHEFLSRSGTFDARNPTYASPNQDVPVCVVDERQVVPDARQVVATLLVGCWAYDDWDLVAATDLFSVHAEDVFLDKDALATGPGGTCAPAEINNCELDESGTFGFCDGAGVCRRRCLDDGDCPCSQGCSEYFQNIPDESIGLGTCDCEVAP